MTACILACRTNCAAHKTAAWTYTGPAAYLRMGCFCAAVVCHHVLLYQSNQATNTVVSRFFSLQVTVTRQTTQQQHMLP